MKLNDLYIIADCADNSVTLSPGLCSELGIKAEAKRAVRIFVFGIKGSDKFGFKRVNAKFAKRAECGVVSYNPIYKSYGFISLIPTVNMIFFKMGIESEQKKLGVEKKKLPDGSHIYTIEPENDKGN